MHLSDPLYGWTEHLLEWNFQPMKFIIVHYKQKKKSLPTLLSVF